MNCRGYIAGISQKGDFMDFFYKDAFAYDGSDLGIRLSENSASIMCPAKINLFLEITGKRNDGYHTIESVMQRVSLCDRVEVRLGVGKGISAVCSVPGVPSGDKNTACVAAEKYLSAAGVSGSVEISIEKIIPVSAGLAGGSADAAGTLAALHALIGRVDEHDLAGIALSVGADVPFCLFSVSALCKGVGERIAPCPSLPDSFIVIAKHPEEAVSTAEAYRLADSVTLSKNGSHAITEALKKGDIARVCSEMKNDFETVLLHSVPYARKAMAVMKDFSALGTMMSGSGPSVFGIFDDSCKAASACDFLASDGYVSFVCRPVGWQRVLP